MRHGSPARRRISVAAPLLVAAMLGLTGCATGGSWPGSTPASPAPAPAESAAGSSGSAGATPEEPAETPPTSASRQQPDSCDWSAPALTGVAASRAPSGQQGELHDVIVGAWQHTHYDSGAGFEALEDKDLRFVLASPAQFRYCQHVPGITDHAEASGAITWDGTTIVGPDGRALYTVTDWSDTAMLWHNELDDSTYLLVRR